MARTFALIALVWRVLQQILCSSKTVPIAPKRKETHQNMSLGSSGVDRECHCEKFWHDFVARTFPLITPVQYVLQQVSCSYEMIPNALKYYETHQNISLGCNGADWVHSLRRILMWLRGTNFFINCTSSPRFAPSFVQLRNDNKCTQTLWNAPKQEFRVQWGGPSALFAKNYNATSRHELLH